MRRLLRRVLSLGLPVALLSPAPATAATFTPTTTADGNNGACTPALCTLRDAITAANTGSEHLVSVPAGHYTLNLGQLSIRQRMTVVGAGARTTTIDAQGTSRVIALDPLFPIDVTIRGVTITGGAANAMSPFPGEGGGILAREGLHLERSAVVGNTATVAGGGISVTFGGAFGTIKDSLIASNTVTGGVGAGSGGGLNSSVAATLVANSTITGNTAANPGGNQGGGVTATRPAGGSGPALTLLNTTIAGNSISGTGPASFGAGLSGDNFAGPPASAELVAGNTIIAENTASGSTQDCGLVDVVGTAHNLSSDATCGFTDVGSKQNTNPRLGALANNGGPTDTLSIGNGSPALNAGFNTGCPAVDQRGTVRPQVAICDIGAFEAMPPDLEVKQWFVTGKGERGRSLASVAKVRRGKKLTFIATVTNKGEQTAPAAQLTVTLPKKASKLKLDGCESVPQKKTKKRKKRKRKPGKKVVGCPLGNVAPAATKEARIKFRPNRGGKLVSKVSVQGQIADANPATDTARTQIRIKRIKRRR